jgi:hypothetical protein
VVSTLFLPEFFEMKNIVILISGRGSNMEALLAAREAGNLPLNGGRDQ